MSHDLDYYEILEISPNAGFDTIDRVFRFLAQRYHPDQNPGNDVEKFTLLVKAHDVLRDPEKRAAYDLRYKQKSDYHRSLLTEAGNMDNLEQDEIIQARLLVLLYTKRKRNIRNPGFGNLELEKLIDCPGEILEFHLWFLKEKGWIARLENGLLAITADGVEKAISLLHTKSMDRQLTDQREAILL